MESTNGIKTWQWVVTVIVIVALIVLGYYMFSRSSTPVETPIAVDNTTSTSSLNSVNRIMVSDQYPGQFVYITSVQLAQPGFVAIYKNIDGRPGDMIGYQYFDKGIYPGKITLTSPTINGEMYYAMLHSDNGDKKFSSAVDMPIKDASGNIIMKPFRATDDIVEIKG